MSNLINETLGGSNYSDESIEQAIRLFVSDYLVIPIYRTRPQNASLPCITYELNNNSYQNNLNDKSGVAEAKIDFYIWAENYADLPIYAQEIRDCLDGFDGIASNRIIYDARHTSEQDNIEQHDGKAKPIYCREMSFDILYLDK